MADMVELIAGALERGYEHLKEACRLLAIWIEEKPPLEGKPEDFYAYSAEWELQRFLPIVEKMLCSLKRR